MRLDAEGMGVGGDLAGISIALVILSALMMRREVA